MKNLFKHTILPFIILVGILALSSCKKYLERSPLADIQETDPYKNFRNFQGFTEELYNCIPLLSLVEGHNSFNLGEDEFWELGETRLISYHIDQGNYMAWNSTFYNFLGSGGDPANGTGNDPNRSKGKLWGLSWYAIRKANVGLANLDKLTDATQEEKDLIAGQLYFFRGYFHFVLMEYWGGLPYIDQVLPSDQVLQLPRLSYQATADKVAADLQRAAALLPVDWDQTVVGKQTAGNNNTRINKIMALGFLGKNYLWAGSPLMNRESTGNNTYNQDYCKKSADALASALQIIESTGRYELAPFSQYRDLFYTFNQNGKIPGLKEAIFLENLAGAGGRWRWNQVNDYRPLVIHQTGIKVYPTANYVDYYGMANGLPITNPEQKDSESGYDPEYPWKNRDPRFYNDIMIDGEKCVLTAQSVGNNEYRQYASLFTNGLFRTADGNKKVWTGYMNSKLVSKLMNEYDGYRENNTFVLSLMRLADVYLLYAEAAATGYGSPQSMANGYGLSAVEAVNKIRTRAGVANVATKFLASNTLFLSELRRERAVELAFEGHRFNDLRRWLLLTERPYTLKKAVEFDRALTNAQVYADPKNARVRNFRETVLFERQLGQRHYWLPFRVEDVNMYKDFKQNPGW
ncbi:RagB/SusD family nutrient uptake outer membrane protein [Pedobacter alluvionis]|uniref:Putative outer membrane starch-binding protein n=1 Tax=Pedobacter alluvionis TaxID=475253 RepID=A0A497Y9R1_9SPHI|nr:RagB/SusD family nutrient uptake outer membrane protein [Pedobacter alluvionis]RLJ79571.1 putative outer membrane starch-binding protein [Pedobacter alluvionis]TFB30907.1 RagB/SusD family nutrient uptake outer membrane protein [Pedobacter alluvionis]